MLLPRPWEPFAWCVFNLREGRFCSACRCCFPLLFLPPAGPGTWPQPRTSIPASWASQFTGATGQSSAASWGPGSAQRHRHQPAASLSERGVGRRAAPHCTITGAKTSDPLFCWTATSQEGLTSQEGSTSLRQARREAKTSSMRAGDATASHVPFADIVPSRLSGRAHERVEVR